MNQPTNTHDAYVPEPLPFCKRCEKEIICEELTGNLCESCWMEDQEIRDTAAFARSMNI
jgi:hypothetical protein